MKEVMNPYYNLAINWIKLGLQGNRLFYLAMAPQFFGVISDFLKSSGLTNTKVLND